MISETLGHAGGKGRGSGTSALLKIAIPVQMRLYRGAPWSSVWLTGYVRPRVLACVAHVSVQLVGPLLFAYTSAYASPVWIAPHLCSTGVSHPHGTRVPSAGWTVTNRGWPHHPLADCTDPPSRWYPVPGHLRAAVLLTLPQAERAHVRAFTIHAETLFIPHRALGTVHYSVVLLSSRSVSCGALCGLLPT